MSYSFGQTLPHICQFNVVLVHRLYVLNCGCKWHHQDTIAQSGAKTTKPILPHIFPQRNVWTVCTFGTWSTHRQPSRITTSHGGSAQSRNSTNHRVKLRFGTRWEIIKEVRASWHLGSRINLRQMKRGSTRRMHQTQQHVPLQWEKQTWPCGRRLAGTRGRQKPDSVCWFEWTRASKLLSGQWRPAEDCKTPYCEHLKKVPSWFQKFNVWRPTFPAQIDWWFLHLTLEKYTAYYCV